MSKCTYSIVDGNIGLMINGETHSIHKEHRNYKAILNALVNEEYDSIPELADLGTAIQVWGKDQITVMDGAVYFKGNQLDDGSLTDRILGMIAEGEECEPMVKFVVNLMSNPDKEVIPQVYRFLRANKLPITRDGCFMAYKRVAQADERYVDIYTGKIDNSIGMTVRENRDLIDRDPERCCSKGLHVCSWKYLVSSGYGGYGDSVLVAVKVNPRDVVSVPTSYNDTKLRCCEYVVIEDSRNQDDPCAIYENKIVWDGKPEIEDDFYDFQNEEEDQDYDDGFDDYDEDYDDRDEDYDYDEDDYTDAEGDVEREHAESKGFHNVRDSKGRFTSSSSSVQPRDSKGRFLSWAQRKLQGK